jgi:hypothetical protein
MRWASSAALVLACVARVAWTAPARAEDQTEASYGRVEGDIAFAMGAGVVAAPRGGRGEVELRARYLDSAGIFATYEDGRLFGSAAEPGRVLSGGLELRPLFLYRWLQGQEMEAARWDLLIDSFGLELGATLSEPSGQGLTQAGLQAGIGVEFPILLRASGPWVGIHGGVRWSDVALSYGQAATADDRGLYLAVTLSWHAVVLTHLVDWRDEPRR